MLLLREIRSETNHLFGGKLDGEEAALYEEVKKEFLSRLDCHLKGKELVRAVYGLTDELVSKFLKNNQIACSKGCSWCCRQLICCTTLEMELIVECMMSLPRKTRREIIRRIKKETIWLGKLFQRLGGDSLLKLDKDQFIGVIKEELKIAYDGRPCPFLNPKELCSIYPVRPIVCRTAKTKDKSCGTQWFPSAKRPKGITLFAERIAVDLITEEDKKGEGEGGVVPLVIHSLTKDFEHFF